MNNAISDLFAWECLDSRGRPTVGCEVRLRDGATGRAIAPAGASTGGHEARELRDRDDPRFDGWGVAQAVRHVTDVLLPLLIGVDADDPTAVDDALELSDPDPLFGSVGANAVLAVSLAATLARAESARQPLWRLLGGTRPLLPMPMINVVSGGAHAAGGLDIQDVLVVPVGATSFAEALSIAWRVRRATAELLAERGGNPSLVADEGGLAFGPDRNEAALALVLDGIRRSGLVPGRDAALAVDVAANQLWTGATYRLDAEKRQVSTDEWLAVLRTWCERYPIVSLEDVLNEDDWTGWKHASAVLGAERQLLGDDLFATNADRLAVGVDGDVANAVLVKPNQAGTVDRAARVVRQAQAAGYATVVSARSGDTEDFWLADLAVGWRAGQIKVGSTTRSERTSKWNRLLEIESRTAGHCDFAGRGALAGSA